MKFLILTQYFPPEIGGAQTRLRSTATELHRLGHQVEVVTALPNYPRGRIFPGYRGCFYRREESDGIRVHRVWIYAAMGGGLARMLNYASFMITSLFALALARKPEFIFVESPPILLSIPAYVAGLFWRVPYIFNVADLWPDIILEGGFMKRGLLVDLLFKLEQWSYRKAARVNAVTDGLRERLLQEKHVPADKLLFLPNGVDTTHFQSRAPDEALKRKLGLEGKKIILWAGTLGTAHGLNYVLDAANLLASESQIHFLFVGDGSAKTALQQQRQDMRLDNVTFLDPVPIEDLPYSGLRQGVDFRRQGRNRAPGGKIQGRNRGGSGRSRSPGECDSAAGGESAIGAGVRPKRTRFRRKTPAVVYYYSRLGGTVAADSGA
jgi:colanic acid biosynthesis glycosyl transferase WcaI